MAGGIKRAFIRRKLEQKIEDLSPSKFAATTFVFADDDDLSKSSLLDKSALMSDAPFVITSDDKSRDDDGVDDDDVMLRDGVRVDRNSTPPADPVHVTVTTTPQSFLHGMIIIEDELGITAHSHVQVTPTPKKGDVAVYQGKLFESSPITQPDEYGKMQGLSFVDESLDYSINNDETPLPTPLHNKMKKNDSSPPSMFQSSPLNTQPDDSLLQESLSSFIRNDDSMLTLERELFDCTISISEKKKREEEEAPTTALYVDTKIDMSEPICITTKKKEMPAHDTKVDMRETIEPLFNESLVRAKLWPTLEQDEGDDECDDNLVKSSLGLNSSRQLYPSTIKKDTHTEEASSSPTGVADFIDEMFFSSSLPPLPQLHHSAPKPAQANASPKTTLMSRLWDQAIGGCHPFDTIGCKVGHCSSDKSTKKKQQQQQQQQQPAAAAVAQTCCSPAPPFASSPMKRPGRVQRVYSPAEELSMARQNANVAQQKFERRF